MYFYTLKCTEKPCFNKLLLRRAYLNVTVTSKTTQNFLKLNNLGSKLHLGH